MKPHLDKVFLETVIPHPGCPACQRACWMIVEGRRRGRCVYGGPYTGYVELPDTKPLDATVQN